MPNHVQNPFHALNPLLLALTAALALPAGAMAQDAVLPETVVTATRVPTPIDRIASSITVIDQGEIARRGYTSLPEALRTVPGLSIGQYGEGSRNGVANLYLRGASSNHTVVLLDGVDVTDPASSAGAFDFSTVNLANVERIEVLRGPQGTLYGSSAIGGVINIITKSGKGPLGGSATVQGGSFGTAGLSGTLHGSLLDERLSFALSAERNRTDGYAYAAADRRASAGAPAFDDGSHDWTVSGKLGYRLSDTLSVSGLIRQSKAFSNYDANPGDPNAELRNDIRLMRGEAVWDVFGGRMSNRVGFASTTYDQVSSNSPDPYYNVLESYPSTGERLKADWQGDIFLTPDQTLTLGAESSRETITSSSLYQTPDDTSEGTTRGAIRNSAGFLQLQSGFFERLYTTIGVRVDAGSRYGEEVTWRVAPAYLIPETGTKLKASYGTGFKAPALSQLYLQSSSSYGEYVGNPDLVPETSRGFDAGVEQTLFDKRLSLGATYFQNRIENMIVYVYGTPSTLTNEQNGRSKGVESYASLAVTKDLDLRLDYTWMALNGDTQAQVVRRPRHKLSLGADWQATEDLSLSTTVLYVGKRKDIGNFTFAYFNQTPVVTMDVSARYKVAPGYTAFGRLTNLLDRTYQNPDGWLAAGRAAMFGVTASF